MTTTINRPHLIDTINSEIDLLLCCARLRLDSKHQAQIQSLLQQELDWNYILQTAAKHKLLPLLYHHCKNFTDGAIRADVLEYLQQSFQQNVQRNLYATAELLKLLQLLEQHQIIAIPYKGAVLAHSFYGNLGLRKFGDLDILVKPEDLAATEQLLIDQGYDLDKNLGWECHFVHQQKQIYVDIHQAIAPPYFDLPLHWHYYASRLQTQTLAGKTIQQFSPEDLLIILCVVLVKDCCHWSLRLIQLTDIAQLLDSESLDWSKVEAQVEYLGCRRMLYLALCLVNQILSVEIPTAIATKIQKDSSIAMLAATVWQRLLWETQHPPILPTETGFWHFINNYNHRFYWQMCDRARDRLDYIFYWLKSSIRVALTPNKADLELVDLPKYLTWVYYPLHVTRLINKYLMPNPAKKTKVDNSK